jgi:exodeoxyribonuclease III
MRIVTLNLNGIRSAVNKGFVQWLAQSGADFVCVQEVKAQADVMTELLARPAGYTGHFHFAQKPGYSGCGIFSKHTPHYTQQGFGSGEFDAEGRYVRFDLGNLTVISAYFPSGTSSEERQQAKFRFLAEFAPHMDALRASGREVLVCGDVNIAHKEIDLKNWKSNQKNSGFLPEERAWVTDLLDNRGWIDVHRTLLGPEQVCYTWWSQRGAAYEKDVGWRLDYHFATPGIAAKAHTAHVYKEQKFSDHAPLVIDYDYAL